MSSPGDGQSFPFMRLPPELRRHFYTIVLPQQDKPIRTSDWTDIIGLPNPFMGLLLVNKQIFNEARTVLFGLNTFTAVVSRHGTSFVHSAPQDVHTYPILLPLSFTLIKNWQLSLGFGRVCRGYLYHGEHILADEVLNIAVQIATIPVLETLKVSVPCLCHKCHCLQQEDMHKITMNILKPLKQLRAKGEVRFIATSSRVFLAHPESRPDKVSLAAEYATKSESASNQQCQQLACLSFAASFNSLRAALKGDSPPLCFTPAQIWWSGLKNLMNSPQRNQLKRRHDVRHAYDHVWLVLEAQSDLGDGFEEAVEAAWRIVNTHNETDTQARRSLATA
ncbi:MAG: hypothetical protein LQ343_005516 [Gyalolechia ehrenbergii]|nr:MAG: hypothetical protein LQ343_005516 [Gyalolechia ehrenbergii]